MSGCVERDRTSDNFWHTQASYPWLCRLITLLVLLLGSSVHAQDLPFNIFSKTELKEIKTYAEEMSHRFRLLHKCAEGEANVVCVKRTCRVDFDGFGGDILETIFNLNKMSDSELKCIFNGMPEMEFILASRQLAYQPSVESSSAFDEEGFPSIDDALAAALGQDPDAPTGPPLSASEKDALRVAVRDCWEVSSLSSLALETTVVVAVSLTQDGKPVVSSIRQVSSEGGTIASTSEAFENARRAIIRCGASGFKLPIGKYDQWKDIEMNFNPQRMRLK
jgi:hypothetical protein